jgi:DegV family protein with EDD domain
MTRIHVVTDSGATVSNPRLLQSAPLTVVPYKFDIAGRLYAEGSDLTGEETLRLIRSQTRPPRLIAPTIQDFVETYTQLSSVYDAIISIHTSRELTESWRHARQAAQQVRDSCRVAVVDSRSICAGQGMLVRLAAEAVLEDDDFDSIVTRVRGASERVYSAYYVETLDFLQANGILSEAHTILGTMLGVKPFLSIEDGRPVIIEKVKSRSQGIDRIVEFLSEFDDLDDAMIVQNRTHITEQARNLQDRLSLEFPGRHFPYSIYSAALAVLLGGDVTGVVVLETEAESLNDAF